MQRSLQLGETCTHVAAILFYLDAQEWKGGNSISVREREGYGSARNLKADFTVT